MAVSLVSYSAFLFDLDGTIWDSENAFITALKPVLEEAVCENIKRELIQEKMKVSSLILLLSLDNIIITYPLLNRNSHFILKLIFY